MSRENKKTLNAQMYDLLNSMFKPGLSKNDFKKNARTEYDRLKPDCSEFKYINDKLRPYIFSYKTLANYYRHCNYFIKWVCCKYPGKERRTLSQCKDYVPLYLEYRRSQGLSPYTLKLDACSLGKLYQCPIEDFGCELPVRYRYNIVRSRLPIVNSFSEKNNEELINFCRHTGLRRSEIETLKPEQLVYKEGNYYLSIKGKGGKERYSLILNNDSRVIDKIKNTIKNSLVWGKCPSHMDIHNFRSEYATALYKSVCRKNIPVKERYCCKSDRAGLVLDRTAMLFVSKNLGHNRINVIASHYLRGIN